MEKSASQTAPQSPVSWLGFQQMNFQGAQTSNLQHREFLSPDFFQWQVILSPVVQ
jgi:hypothetical protein